MAGVSTSVSVNDNMSTAFANMTIAINTCLSAFMDIQQATAEGFDSVAIENARNALSDMNEAAMEVARGIEESENQQQKFNNAATQGTNAMDGLLGKVVGVVGAYASWRAVEKVIETTDALTNATARVDMMNDGVRTTEEVMERIFQSAQEARGSYLDMANMVAKVGNNAREAFSSTDEIISFAELVQKQFTIAGASTTEASNAMLQLTQALGSGVLRGDELNSIFDQAPNLIQNIADYMGISVGQIREMAKEGEITADIVKNAMFESADEINEKFATMPTTWAQVGQLVSDQALKIFQPALDMIGQMTQMEEFQTVVTGITNGFAALANVATPVIELMINGAAWIVENWSWISPVIGGVVTVMGIYLGVLAAYNVAQAISNGLKTASAIASVAHGTATAAEAAATVGMTTAQMNFNAALYACPVTWILVAIIAIIAIIYAVVAAINKATDSTISATGVIVGVLSVAGSAIWNIIYGVITAVIGIGVEFYNLIVVFSNFLANVFRDPVGAIANLFFGLVDIIIGVVQTAANAIDALLGTDISGAIAGFRGQVADFAESIVGEQIEVLGKVSQEEVINQLGITRLDPVDAYNWGYEKGQGIEEGVTDFFGNFGKLDELSNQMEEMGDYGAITAGNTGDIADSLEITEDNMAWLKDIAEREIIDRTVFRDIKVDMGGVNNIVNNNQDLDSIGQYLVDTIEEQMVTSAEGA